MCVHTERKSNRQCHKVHSRCQKKLPIVFCFDALNAVYRSAILPFSTACHFTPFHSAVSHHLHVYCTSNLMDTKKIIWKLSRIIRMQFSITCNINSICIGTSEQLEHTVLTVHI